MELEVEKDNTIVFLDMRIRKKEGRKDIHRMVSKKFVRPETIAMLGVMWITRRRETL